MTRAAVIIAIILAAIAIFFDVLAAAGLLLVLLGLVMVFSPFLLSGNIAEAEDNAIGDWPTIIDLEDEK